MKIVTVDDVKYEFDESRLMNTEAKAIQAATGMTVPKWQAALNDFDVDAMTALVWMLRRRAGEKELRFGDVEFNLASLNVQEEGAEPDVEPEPLDPTSAPPASEIEASATT